MKKWTKTACLALCAGLLVSGVAAGLAGDPKDDLKKAQDDLKKQVDDAKKKVTQPPAAPAAPAPGGAADDPMAMMLEMSKPVAEHDIIKNFAGTWKAEMKLWMDPTAKEPTESSGTMKGTLLHGGRYLLGEFTGTFAGAPFSGTMLWGYNRIEKRYESTWCDAWGTGILMSIGQPSADGKTVNTTASFRMPGPDGKLMEITQRERTTMVSKDKYTLEMWHGTKEQGEMKVMEITYTRADDKVEQQRRNGVPMPASPTVPAGVTLPPATR